MSVDRPLLITVYNRTFGRLGWIDTPRSASVTLNHNLPNVATFALDEDHEYVPALTAAGARVVIEYMGLDSPRRLISGVVSVTGERDGAVGTVTFAVTDDKSLFWTLLGWPNPTGTIDQQGDEDAYYVLNGQSAEYALKRVVELNEPHVDLPLTIVPSAGRGDQIDLSIRMHPIADRILPALDQAGIGMDAYQDGAGITVDVYEPQDRSSLPALTEDSGVVQSGSWSQSPPTVTRVVVGGPGEGTARQFVRVPSTLPSALETQWGVSIEQWVDARDVEGASLLTTMRRRGETALAEGAPQVTLQATLAETEFFRFGVAYDLGDILPVQLSGAPVISDRVRSINFSLTADDGLVITPQIGTDDGFEHVTLRHIARLAARVRNQEVSY